MTSNHLTMFSGHWFCDIIRREIINSNCRVTSPDHVIKGSRDFIVGSSLYYVTNIYIVIVDI